MLNIKRRLQQLAIMLPTMLIVWLGAYQPTAWAVLDISPVPLVTSNAAKPNIYLTFDDSGSMRRAYLPDSISGSRNQKRGCSSAFNATFYNPAVDYRPPMNADGSRKPNATWDIPTWNNGFYLNTSYKTDIKNLYIPTWRMNNTDSDPASREIKDDTDCGLGSDTPAGNDPQTAYYMVYTACGGGPSDNTCYTKQVVSTTSGPSRLRYYRAGIGTCPTPAVATNTDCVSSDETINFANWYTYYRTRLLFSISAASIAFAGITDDSVRIAYQRINTCNGGLGVTPPPGCPGTILKRLTDTVGTEKTKFFNWLQGSPADDGTSLRAATKRIGDYVSMTPSNVNNPFAKIPGSNNTEKAACRQNFHVVFTDGLWNGAAGLDGNFDRNAGSILAMPLPDGQATALPQEFYPAGGLPPYTDALEATDGRGSLADNAFYYWSRDLQPTLENIVPTSIKFPNAGSPSTEYWDHRNDPATWQHIVHYTVGLGVDGTLNFPGDLATLVAGTTNWPQTGSGAQNVDDLWHAALNSRGEYFSAADPDQLVASFTNVLNSIKERSASTAPISTNSTQLFTGSRVYQASFNSGTWYGGLASFTTTDGINFTLEWDTTSSGGTGFNGQTNTTRKIVTYDVTATPTGSNTKGIPFQWASITTAQQNSLHDDPTTAAVDNDGQGNARLDYIRGDKSNEGALGNKYRARTTTNMGDIVNSSPVVIGPTSLVFSDSLESAPHSTFRTFTKSRKAIAYFGANDGMLHGIDASFDPSTNASGADAGKEVMAYIPSMLIPDLSKLANPGYQHKFYVDGALASGDAFGDFPRSGCSPACWSSVLVGGLGAGGKGIFGLDVTDPSLYTNETNANKFVLWEFTDATDLGFTFGTPVITRVHKAGGGTQWVAIFGNGYKSTGGKAVLYIVDIVTGTLIKKIDTGVGVDNGLSSPTVVDEDGDFIFDVVYAGDLRGNLWKFNLRNPNPSLWDVAIQDAGGTNLPVFTAVEADGTTPQPITVKPVVIRHPDNLGGYVVYFGTGKYFGDPDTSPTTNQSFYAIWDKNAVNGSDAGLPLVLASSPVPSATHAAGDTELLRQTVDPTTQTTAGGEFRLTSNNTITWRTATSTAPHYLGWYMDLPTGEKTISDPVIIDNKVLFISIVPTDNECGFGGDSFIMEADIRSGSRLATSPFDVDGDGLACGCATDTLSGNVPTGTKVKGIVKGVAILSGGGGGGGGGPRKIFYDPVTKKPKSISNDEQGTKQRQSWKQLR